jgi:hypothetical protein
MYIYGGTYMKKHILIAFVLLLSFGLIFAQGPEKKVWNNGSIDYLPLGTKLRLENETLNPEAGAIFYSFNFTDSQPYNEPVVLDEEGQFWLSYATQDAFGTISPVKHYTAIVDGTAPELKYLIHDAYYIDENQNVYFTSNTSLVVWGEDTGSGTENLFVRVNDSEYIDFIDENMIYLSDDHEDGAYQLESYLVDRVGNTSATTSQLVYLDNTAPEVEIEISPDTIILNDEVFSAPTTLLSFTANDEGSGVKDIFVSINGAEFASVQSDYVVPETGENTVRFYAVDKLGNKSDVKEVSFSNALSLPETELYLEIE